MKQQLTREALVAKDACDPLCKYRDAFLIPDGMIYLDGNSLGMLPHACAVRARQVVEEEWGRTLISSWNEHGWIDLPLRIGAKIAVRAYLKHPGVNCCPAGVAVGRAQT